MKVTREYITVGDDPKPRLNTLYAPDTVEEVLDLGVAFADDHKVILPMSLVADICRRIKALEGGA